MNTVSLGKLRKLAIRKMVFPALFGLVALAAQMIAPVAYLYAQGTQGARGTVTLIANVKSKSIICMSLTINGSSLQHPHIHNDAKPVKFTDVADPGESGTIKTFNDHTCKKSGLTTMSIKIPTIPTAMSKCTFGLDTKVENLVCQ